MIAEIADRFGPQVLVLSVDARRAAERRRRGFEVTTHGGRRGTGIDAVGVGPARPELGAGEILLNSMDADGTKDGFDLRLIAAVRAAVGVPVIACGGAGALGHFPPAVAAGADAVLAASVFHFGELSIGEVKDEPAGRRQSGALSRSAVVGEPERVFANGRGVRLFVQPPVRVAGSARSI